MIGGCRGQGPGRIHFLVTSRARNTVRFDEVKYGPFGGCCCNCGAGYHDNLVSPYGCCYQRPASPVSFYFGRGLLNITSVKHRLNAHAASIISSMSPGFHVPAELVARAKYSILCDGAVSLSPHRLSSFGFSGTIAHGAFVSPVRA